MQYWFQFLAQFRRHGLALLVLLSAFLGINAEPVEAFSISGRVTNSAGNPISGVKIESTGTVQDGIFTNSNGDYTLTGAANGTYTIFPDKDNVAFTPATRTVTVNNANVVGVNFVASAGGAAGTLSISGRVVNAAEVGISGVKIESTGEVNDGVFTNANGFYTLTGAAAGTYTIIPDKDDVTFTPATRTVTVASTNLTGINFTASGAGAGALTISGRVTNRSGIGVAGVRIESTGEVEDGVLTNANGFYTLTGAEAGNYAVTPDKDGMVFSPITRTVTVGTVNVSGVNFVAQGGGAGQGTLTISGRVVNGSGVGVSGVRIESTGEVNDGVLTNINGFYTLTGAAPGNYIITPDKTDTAFTPSARAVTVGSANLTGVDFTATPGRVTGSFTITGRITNSAGLGVSGVRIESSGAIADGVLTNSNGFYTLVGVPNGSYIITPDKDGVAFTPTARSVTVNGASATGVNFAAQGGNAGFGSYTISGRIVDSAGRPVAGVRIESTGEVVDGILTNTDGVYVLTRVAPGSYIVTPDLDNATFNPERIAVNVTNGNVSGVNFVVTRR
jgi:protocatechuate 3,4-dioxygenase beta subunit